MSIQVDGADGVKFEAFTADELEAAKAEAIKTATESVKAESEKAVNEAKAEADKYRRVAQEQTENFKKVREMTEEEKSKYSAETLEALRKAEIAEERAKALEDKYNEDTNKAFEKRKTTAVTKYAGTDAELSKKILENFALINIEGTDEDTVNSKMEMAAKMAGLSKPADPLKQTWSGAAPDTGAKNFGESERGKAADKLIGDIKFN